MAKNESQTINPRGSCTGQLTCAKLKKRRQLTCAVCSIWLYYTLSLLTILYSYVLGTSPIPEAENTTLSDQAEPSVEPESKTTSEPEPEAESHTSAEPEAEDSSTSEPESESETTEGTETV